MRHVAEGSGKPLKITAEQRSRLREFLINAHMNIETGRAGLVRTWRNCLRILQGRPDEKRWVPFENAPLIEITIAALFADAIAARALNLIFQVNPPATVRSRKTEFDQTADAMQDLVDWGVQSGKWKFKPSMKDGILDACQLGTEVFYIPWMKTVRKTDVFKTISQGPCIYSLDPKDFLISLNCQDPQDAQICTMRMWMDAGTYNLKAKMENWWDDAGGGGAAETVDPVGRDRLRLAGIDDGMSSGAQGKLYEICDTFCYFDIDDDGIEESLEVIWNRTTGGIKKAMFNRWDTRPFVMKPYQDRAHIAYGIGIIEATMSFEQAITELFNNFIWNAEIANTKMYQGPAAAMDESKAIYPGKYWDNDLGEIKPVEMGEVTQAPIQVVMSLMSIANQRVGMTEMSAPSRLGGRTPGITALTAFQQAEVRFFLPFDNMREGGAEAIQQCIYRIQEKVRKGGSDAEEVVTWLTQLLGIEKSMLLVQLFKRSEVELTDALNIEITASSVSINREADRQAMVQVAQVYKDYVVAMTQLAQTKATPPFPGADKMADLAAEAINKFMYRFLRTFDQITDVEGYLITLDSIHSMADMGVDQLTQNFSNQLGLGTNGGAPPPAGPSPESQMQ